MERRTTTRRRGGAPGVAAAVLVGLLLTGCGEPAPTGAPSGTAPTGSVPPSPAATPTAAPSPSAPSPSAPTVPGADGSWGAYQGREEACAAVADDLLALALLPASLSGGTGVEQLQDVEDQVADMLAAAPAEITAELARVQLLVDSYGEELAADPSATFDGRSLDETLTPVRDWLGENCRDAS